MRRLWEIAHDAKSHFRPLNAGARFCVEWLQHCESLTDGVMLPGDTEWTGRQLVQELVKNLPAPTTESQRWLMMELKELTQ